MEWELIHETSRQAVLNRDAMVYPALRDLMEGGYLDCRHEVAEGERQHVCRLTDKGKETRISLRPAPGNECAERRKETVTSKRNRPVKSKGD